MRQVETPDSRTLTYEYDDNGRVTRTLDDAGRDTLTEYDALGRVVRRFGPVHDAIDADNPLTTLNHVRRVTAFERDTLGNVTGIRAGHANAAGLIQQLRLIASYTYDDFGNVLTETDAHAETTHYVYDRHHNLIETRYPNGDTIAVVLDHSRNGLNTSRRVADASSASAPEQTRYFYNALGQALRIEHPHVDYNYTVSARKSAFLHQSQT